ncbi:MULTISPECIES: COG1361 family protein [Streptomyces]|uniref:Lipoprotein n=1 Tax=Streptomyces rutgersensis TaxID=53451 RepID=A0ABX6RL55_9ACTN|nr:MULTISPECIES: hypothetical protein [Streptomyces]NEE59677.1 hypothetical protein [Streptomyces sp. SID8455]MBL3806688.1 hypothetical protein [Streptomyces sp. BRB081]PJM84922.1 hypothetical protein CH313_02755 [Streptomyces sp. TSRI0384-2]QNE81227.1 hypothetical protein F0345_09025 [Streptomyces rutgersensis]WPR51189.1 hypothetical protein SJI45_09225 [Streptomyces sp. S399]
MSRHKRRFGVVPVVPVVLAASALLVTGCDSPSGAPDAKESPAAADSGGPPPGLEAFHAKDCPALTEGEQANGNLISLSHDQPEKGVTVRPGGAPATVLVKLCNTTDRPLTNIALSTQLEWSDAGERSPGLKVERRETPDGTWRAAELVVANDHQPLTGADGARDLAPGATRVVEYRFRAAEDAPSGARPLTIHAVRADADPGDIEELRGGGTGSLPLRVLPRD